MKKLLLIALLFVVFSSQSQTYKYTWMAQTGMRSQPSYSSIEFLQIPKDSKLEVLDYEGADSSWVHIKYNSETGYVRTGLVSDIPDEVIEGKSTNKTSEAKKAPSYKPSSSSTVRSSPVSSKRTYYTGPKGGCYYYSSSGKKVYVDRSLCN